jgi:glutaryl-CoA dehydrogenase
MSKPQFHWEDPLLLQDQLTTEERMIADAAREYAQGKLASRVHEAFRSETTDPTIFREMGELGRRIRRRQPQLRVLWPHCS